MLKRSLANYSVSCVGCSFAWKNRKLGQRPKPPRFSFRDVTQSAHIHFVHNNGAFGKKFLPETMGPGVAFIDCDGDGWPDIFVVNGMDWPGHVQKHSTPKLYHNNHDGTFTDVTHKAGLDVEMFGMGVAVGDYDKRRATTTYSLPRTAKATFSQQWQRHLHGCHAKGRPAWAERIQLQRRVGRLRQGR